MEYKSNCMLWERHVSSWRTTWPHHLVALHNSCCRISRFTSGPSPKPFLNADSIAIILKHHFFLLTSLSLSRWWWSDLMNVYCLDQYQADHRDLSYMDHRDFPAIRPARRQGVMDEMDFFSADKNNQNHSQEIPRFEDDQKESLLHVNVWNLIILIWRWSFKFLFFPFSVEN